MSVKTISELIKIVDDCKAVIELIPSDIKAEPHFVINGVLLPVLKSFVERQLDPKPKVFDAEDSIWCMVQHKHGFIDIDTSKIKKDG